MTTSVVSETGEAVNGAVVPTEEEVQHSIVAARKHGARFFKEIVWQVEHRAWEPLGYESWDAMREAEYADMGVVVPRADRPELVSRLRGAGLKQGEVAKTLGVSKRTIEAEKDKPQSCGLSPTTHTDSLGRTRPSTYKKKDKPDDDPPKEDVDLTLINDIRLYLRALATASQIAALSPTGRAHIITALQDTIDTLEDMTGSGRPRPAASGPASS